MVRRYLYTIDLISSSCFLAGLTFEDPVKRTKAPLEVELGPGR